MNASTVMLILNIVFFAILVIGFLFGLKGAKKSTLSLIFFIVAVCLTLIITPAVTNALLKININYNGDTMPIKEVITTLLKENATIKELASSGSNTEALIQNMPQMLGNLVTFMALTVVVGFVFWIAYLITARCIFKKNKKKKEEKNPLSKDTPSYVSATGNVTYVKETKQKKHRLVGGLIGAVHSLAFLIVFLIPICGTARLLNQVAYGTEEQISPTAVVTLLDAQISAQESETNEDVTYTPSAKLIQENFPAELLEISKSLDNSIIGNLCGIVNVNNCWLNGIAKCDVNGEKIVLTKEIDTVITVYDNVEFINSIDFSDASSIKTINFNKLRKAVNTLTDSSVVKSLAPELTIKYLDWITREDISDLDPAVVDGLSSIRQQLDDEPNLKELVVEIKNMLSDETTTMEVFKAELLNLLDIAEIVVQSDLIDELVKTEPDEKNVITILHANNNALMNSLIDELYESDFVSLATLTALNYGIDALQVEIDAELKDDAVTLSKIVLNQAKNNVDSSVLKSATNFIFELYLNADECLDENDELDTVKFVETYGKTTVDNIAKVLDDVKNMQVLKQFNILSQLVTNLKKISLVPASDSDPEKFVSDFLDLDTALTDTYSFISDFANLSTLIENAKAITFTQGEEGNQKQITLIERLINQDDELTDILQELDKEQLSSILRPATSITFIKPFVNEIVDELNQKISDSVSEVGNLLPPDIDIGEHIDEVIDVVDSVSDVLPILDKMDNLDNDKSLAENLKEQLDDSEKDSIASLLDTLQENANNDGIFKEAYENLVETAKDDSKSGLDGLAEIIDKNTVTEGDTTTINWQAIIDEYLKTSA